MLFYLGEKVFIPVARFEKNRDYYHAILTPATMTF